MPSPIEQAIRHHVRDYLDRRLELHQFEDWFLPILWDIDSSGDQSAIDLASEIHILLAEYSSGDRSLDSFRKELDDATGSLVGYGPEVSVEPLVFVYGKSRNAKTGNATLWAWPRADVAA